MEIETIYVDSISIRAIELMPGSLAFAASNGVFGSVDLQTGKVRANIQSYDSILPEFRAIAHTATDFFMLSVANPALLYKTGNSGKMELIYKEEGEGVFYDAMTFWNDKEGIAVGDSMDGCLSIIISRDGGDTWKKTPCSDLPKTNKGEGAFAASNTNIKTLGDHTWIATTEGTIYYSGDKGRTWEVFTTPMVKDKPTEGIYSIDFNDDELGVAIGGDYTAPENNLSNKAITKDGGKTWEVIADGQDPGYKSCIQFIPNSGGEDMVALGFTGISYSKDMGKTWVGLSEESFYTIRFLNDSTAYAAGRNRIAKLSFK
ncbi:MAG: oxidoreductase [Saonia sp.]